MESRRSELLHQMQRTLAAQATNVASLGRMVDELEAWSDVLDGVDEHWRQSFHNAWSLLEEVLAVARDQEVSDLDEEANRLISSATLELRELVCAALSDNGVVVQRSDDLTQPE